MTSVSWHCFVSHPERRRFRGTSESEGDQTIFKCPDKKKGPFSFSIPYRYVMYTHFVQMEFRARLPLFLSNKPELDTAFYYYTGLIPLLTWRVSSWKYYFVTIDLFFLFFVMAVGAISISYHVLSQFLRDATRQMLVLKITGRDIRIKTNVNRIQYSIIGVKSRIMENASECFSITLIFWSLKILFDHSLEVSSNLNCSIPTSFSTRRVQTTSWSVILSFKRNN